MSSMTKDTSESDVMSRNSAAANAIALDESSQRQPGNGDTGDIVNMTSSAK